MGLIGRSYRKGVLETLNLLWMKLPLERTESLEGYGSDIIGKKYIVYFDDFDCLFKAEKL